FKKPLVNLAIWEKYLINNTDKIVDQLKEVEPVNEFLGCGYDYLTFLHALIKEEILDILFKNYLQAIAEIKNAITVKNSVNQNNLEKNRQELLKNRMTIQSQ